MSDSDSATRSAGSSAGAGVTVSPVPAGTSPVGTGSGSHGPTYSSRRRVIALKRSIASREVTVVNHASGRSSIAGSARW